MDSPNPVPVQDERKPDPEEPWRYLCPECHAQVKGRRGSQRYACGKCRQLWTKRELYDQKANGTPESGAHG